MAEDSLIFSCSPTLAGIKAGNLFPYTFPDQDRMRRCIREWNRVLHPKGIAVVPLRYREGKTLIYLYRPERLKNSWLNKTAEKILLERGYDTGSVPKSVAHLVSRFAENDQFPHEIGLFLDYPAEDVQGFIDQKAQNYKMSGYWKVYGNVEDAKKIFERYKRCKQVYMKRFAAGETIGQLAVATA